MKWVLGLTGGIAVGKTQVANQFAELGAHLIDADVIAREVVAPGSKALAAIAEHFGEKILVKGELDRAKLRQRIFANAADKKWLEELLHPLIRQTILQDIRAATSAPYSILIAPLLFENGLNSLTQRTLVVDASEEQQLSRSLARDGSDPAILNAIMAAQMPRQQRLAQADDQLDNSGPWPQTLQAIAILHQQYLKLAAEYASHNTLNPLPHV
ncbi:MAG TPA: dephospho-CoA kinase [Cellvibrionaceae bacterium]